jgi:hypothetical protein
MTVAVTAFEFLFVVGRTVVHVLIVAVGSVEPTLAGITVVRHFDEELSWGGWDTLFRGVNDWVDVREQYWLEVEEERAVGVLWKLETW